MEIGGTPFTLACTVAFVSVSGLFAAHSGSDVLVVVNQKSTLSRRIGDYYVKKRQVPLAQVCALAAPLEEEISRQAYNDAVERPVAACLQSKGIVEKVIYIVTTMGVPLKIAPVEGTEMQTDAASVDSELAALYGRQHGVAWPIRSAMKNPMFQSPAGPFTHAKFPIYLVARLAGYSFEDVQGLVDRSLVAKDAAKDQGTFVFDARADNNTGGNSWLRAAAQALPKARVSLEDSPQVVYDRRDVIGYASWGSNDPDRHRRHLGFRWLPGALATEYVSTNARTFAQPPAAWTIGTWKDTATWFAGSPQTMTADLVQEGATGVSGHVYEPFLELIARPDYLFPAYFAGRTLGESFYISMPAISWMNVVIGDPLCRIR